MKKIISILLVMSILLSTMAVLASARLEIIDNSEYKTYWKFPEGSSYAPVYVGDQNSYFDVQMDVRLDEDDSGIENAWGLSVWPAVNKNSIGVGDSTVSYSFEVGTWYNLKWDANTDGTTDIYVDGEFIDTVNDVCTLYENTEAFWLWEKLSIDNLSVGTYFNDMENGLGDYNGYSTSELINEVINSYNVSYKTDKTVTRSTANFCGLRYNDPYYTDNYTAKFVLKSSYADFGNMGDMNGFCAGSPLIDMKKDTIGWQNSPRTVSYDFSDEIWYTVEYVVNEYTFIYVNGDLIGVIDEAMPGNFYGCAYNYYFSEISYQNESSVALYEDFTDGNDSVYSGEVILLEEELNRYDLGNNYWCFPSGNSYNPVAVDQFGHFDVEMDICIDAADGSLKGWQGRAVGPYIGVGGIGIDNADFDADIVVGEWYHVAFINNGDGTTDIYLDDQFVGTSSKTITTYPGDNSAFWMWNKISIDNLRVGTYFNDMESGGIGGQGMLVPYNNDLYTGEIFEHIDINVSAGGDALLIESAWENDATSGYIEIPVDTSQLNNKYVVTFDIAYMQTKESSDGAYLEYWTNWDGGSLTRWSLGTEYAGKGEDRVSVDWGIADFNNFHEVTYEFNDTNARIYLDGNVVYEGIIVPDSATHTMSIFCMWNGNAVIDNFRVINIETWEVVADQSSLPTGTGYNRGSGEMRIVNLTDTGYITSYKTELGIFVNDELIGTVDETISLKSNDTANWYFADLSLSDLTVGNYYNDFSNGGFEQEEGTNKFYKWEYDINMYAYFPEIKSPEYLSFDIRFDTDESNWMDWIGGAFNLNKTGISMGSSRLDFAFHTSVWYNFKFVDVGSSVEFYVDNILIGTFAVGSIASNGICGGANGFSIDNLNYDGNIEDFEDGVLDFGSDSVGVIEEEFAMQVVGGYLETGEIGLNKYWYFAPGNSYNPVNVGNQDSDFDVKMDIRLEGYSDSGFGMAFNHIAVTPRFEANGVGVGDHMISYVIEPYVWYHVEYISDGSSTEIYVNNEYIGTVPETPTLYEGNQAFYYWLNMSIDNFRVGSFFDDMETDGIGGQGELLCEEINHDNFWVFPDDGTSCPIYVGEQTEDFGVSMNVCFNGENGIVVGNGRESSPYLGIDGIGVNNADIPYEFEIGKWYKVEWKYVTVTEDVKASFCEANGCTTGETVLDYDSTCASYGQYSNYCCVCGELKNTYEIAMKEHNWAGYDINRRTEDGLVYTYCLNGGDCTQRRYVELPDERTYVGDIYYYHDFSDDFISLTSDGWRDYLHTVNGGMAIIDSESCNYYQNTFTNYINSNDFSVSADIVINETYADTDYDSEFYYWAGGSYGYSVAVGYSVTDKNVFIRSTAGAFPTITADYEMELGQVYNLALSFKLNTSENGEEPEGRLSLLVNGEEIIYTTDSTAVLKEFAKSYTEDLHLDYVIMRALGMNVSVDNYTVASSDFRWATPCPGDVSGDHVLDGDDVLLMRKYVVGELKDTDIFISNADMNGDSRVDPKDIFLMRCAIANQ